MVETLTLWNPHKLLKNLGALSEYAKCSQSSTKIKKKLKSLLSILDTMEWSKNPSHATVPLNAVIFTARGASLLHQFLIAGRASKEFSQLENDG
jgi:hypothetical protein